MLGIWMRPRAAGAARLVAAALLATPVAGFAADFAVSGTIVVNGQQGALPDGGAFAGSAYDAATGAIAAGRFTFPASTASNGAVTVRYQLSQTDTSAGQVAADGVAVLEAASLKLAVLSATYSGVPVPLGTCEFQPILLELAGSGVESGLDLADAQFDIPPAPAGNCGAFRDQINAAFAGSDNGISVHLDGDFAPPAGDDTIFRSGFDPR